MVTNCTTENSFSQMKRIKDPNRTTMRQERHAFLSLLMMEADLLHQINFEDLIKDFALKKCRRKLFKVLFCFIFEILTILTPVERHNF
jgi:DNA (cytosine-5)-methyltransferase 1